MSRSGRLGSLIPEQVQHGEETITVRRAWPSSRAGRLARIEGPDSTGRLRAGLLDLSGTSRADHRVRLTPYGEDRRLPGLADAVVGGTLVVHRLRRRAVVKHSGRYTKVVRDSSAPEITARTRAGGQLAEQAGFLSPVVVGSAAGRIDLSVVPGQDLHTAGGDLGLAAWRRAWDAWSDAWPRLAGGCADSAGLPSHTAADELASLRSWLGHVDTFDALPLLRRELVARCRTLSEVLASSESDRPVLSHRDLHDKQLLWDGRRIGLLDLDTLALAEPACDLANLAVHAELRGCQGLWSRAHVEVVLEQVAHVAARLEVRPQRLRAYAEATRLRLTMLYAFRPRWAPLMPEWLHGG